MHEKNIALLCDEADRLLQLNINLLRQMVEEPDVLSDSKNENRLLFDKQKALKRIEELEGEQIKTARREMVLAVVGTMKAGKSTTINAIVGQEILPNRNRPMTSVPTLIRHVPGKTEPVLHLEHIQPVRNLLITLQEKLATPAGQQVAQTLQQTGDTRELLDILTDDGWLKNEYHGEEEIFTGLASRWALIRREWLRHWQSVVHRSAWFQGPALAHSMVPLSRPLPICQKLPYACWIPPALMRPDNRRWK